MRKVSMKTAVFTIKDHSDITKTISYLHSNYTRSIDDGKPLVVTIKPQECNRTLAQNRLIHMWFGEIAKHTGDTSENIKYLMKRKFFAAIIVNECEQSREQYQAVIDFKKVIENMDESEQPKYWRQYSKLVKMFVNDHLKTRSATTKQLSDFCNKIHDFAYINLGLHLTCPDDLKYLIQ